MRKLAVILSTVFLLGTMAIAVGLSFAQDADQPTPVQRYIPDQDTPWQPDRNIEPNTARTIYAERVVLRGERCTIVIDATSGQPGITVQDLRTGQRCAVYLDARGEAVVGVSTPARKELAAGLFTSQSTGYLQAADPRGVHVFSGRELNGNRNYGRLLQE